MLRLLTAVLVTGCLGAPLAAFAQAPPETLDASDEGELSDEEIERAREYFQAGRAAYDDGRFEDALVHFRHAHELTGNADVLYNIAPVADRLRRDEVALEAYSEFLEARPETTDRNHIEGRIRVLRQQIERERERQNEEARRDEARIEDPVRRPDPRPVDPGPSDPGALPWIVAGGGAAVAIGGGVLLWVASSDVSAVEDPDGDMPRWEDVQHRHDRAPALSVTGGGLLGVGAAAAVGGLSWALLSGGGGVEDPAVDVAVGPGGVRVRGRL